MLNRRSFIATAASVTVGNSLLSGDGFKSDRYAPVCVFTKPFQSLTYDELADKIAEIGVDGIEATIRDGGHIEPKRVPEELPKMVEALAARNLKITVMTSSINDPNDPVTESVLKTAALLGIRRYRMKYFHYDLNKPIAGQIANFRSQCKELAALNHDFGITGLYQNHAGGKYVGAAIWDLSQVLDGIKPGDIGVAYDIRHATVEGGTSWPITFKMIRPHIDTVYVKDFVWGEGARPTNVPLGEGRVDPKFFAMLAESGFNGPVSLHEEYLDHRDPALVPKHMDAIKKDWSVLKKWLSPLQG